MKIKSIVKKWYAIALAVILLLPGLSFIKASAAGYIEVDKLCTLTITVEGSEYAEEFKEMEIPVSLYKVADVDAAGNFTAVGAFGEMDFSVLDSETTAEDWLAFAEQAAGYASGAEVAAQTVVKTAEGADMAQAVIGDLPVGLYLVAPEDTYNPTYSYKYIFTPYLTALPFRDIELSENGTGKDEWVYEPVIGLKAGMEDQYGKLSITKNLSNYNESLGPVTFVFLVEAVNSAGVTVYSNVVSTTHSAAGNETVTLEKIPAGATVTVTEVYSGASYTASGDEVREGVVIYSEKAVEEGAAQTSVSFTNKYDGGTKGGYGVLNCFDPDGQGGWIWENPIQNEE